MGLLVMANEEEMESFDVSERDLYEAFQPGQRRYKKLTKNQQTYGIFNNEDEDESLPSSSFVGRQKKMEFNKQVDFVKSGVEEKSENKSLNFLDRYSAFLILSSISILIKAKFFYTVMIVCKRPQNF